MSNSKLGIARHLKLATIGFVVLFALAAFAFPADAAAPSNGVAESHAPAHFAPAPATLASTPNPGSPRFVEMDGANTHDSLPPQANGPSAPISGTQLNPASPAPIANFEGPHNTVDCTVPPDSDGAVGPTYYVGFVNNYNKCATGPGTGNVQFFCKAIAGSCTSIGQVKGGFYISDLYTGVSGGCNSPTQHTDPQIVYDSAKDRYLIVDITTTSPYFICVASSLSNDPIGGSWCVTTISSPSGQLPDYEKIGIWPDGLYIGEQDNGLSSSTTHHVVVVNKDDMESCSTVRVQTVSMASDTSKTTYGCGTSNGHQAPRPASYNILTGIPAAGEPEFIVADYCLNNALFVDTLHVDWANSANTLLTKGSLTVQTTGLAPSTVSNSGADKMDTLRLELLYPAAYYKDASGNEHIFVDQTVQGSSSSLSAIAWYDLKVVNGAAGATVSNQNVWNPDATNRLAGSGAWDRNGDILMAYSHASSSLAPSVAYAGRLATDAANTFGQTETNLYTGSGFSGSCNGACSRWGDYSSTMIDQDGCTYWFTGETYRQTGDAWQWDTQIGATAYSSCTPLTTLGSSTSSLSYTANAVGQTTAAQTATITNTGTGVLVLQAAKLSGTNAADFAITQDNCKGVAVAAGNTCTVLLTYTPSTSGSESASLAVGDNTAAAHTLTTSLSGSIVSCTPSKLSITTQPPSSVTTGSNFGMTVQVQTAAGVLCSSATNAVTATLASGPGALGGTTTVNAVGGIATFSALTLSNAGTDTLAATATGLTAAPASTSISVTAPQPGVLTGTVKDQSNNAIAGATVSTTGTATLSTTTDASGTYTFSSANPGAYTVTASKPGYAPSSASATVIASQTTTQNFVLSPHTGCFTTNTQAGWLACTNANVDTSTVVGSIQLSGTPGTPAIDQQNTNTGGTFGFNVAPTVFSGGTFTPTVSGQLTEIDGFFRYSSGTASNIIGEIRSTSGGAPTSTVLATSSAVAGGTSTTGAWFQFTFPTPITVTAGTMYALDWKSDGATYVMFQSQSAVTGEPTCQSSDSGSTWNCSPTHGTSPSFKEYVTGASVYSTSGTSVSTALDAAPISGEAPQWTTLTWSATTPASTSVKFQVAASNSASGPFSFVGPDGTSATFFTTSGASLSQFNGFRYLEWKAYLATTDTSKTPVLASVQACYQDVSATPSISVSSASGNFGGTAPVSATLTVSGTGLSGKLVSFSLNGNSVGSATTNGAGLASLSSASLAGIATGSYPSGVSASFAGDSTYSAVSGTAALSVIGIPTTTAGLSGTSGSNGWYVSNVLVTLTCTPQSVDTCTSTTYAIDGGATQTYSAPFTISAEGTHTVTFQSTSSSGGSETQKSTSLKIDKTAPTVSLTSRLPAANANGWNNANVVVTWSCSDSISGVVASSVSTTISTEGAGQTASNSCVDQAGNTAAATQGGISLDKTAPTIGSASLSPAANANGWRNVDVTGTWACSDALSGATAASATATTSGEGSALSITGTCTDLAGNTASNSASGIKVDKTAPTIGTASLSPATNANGWRNVDVTGTWACSDALSGATAASVTQTTSGEGSTLSITGTCTDLAGNTASNTASGIKVDKTAPTIGSASLSPAVNANGWRNVDVTGTWACSDALSGATAASATATTSGEGSALSITGTCTDLAGNTASNTASGIKVDKTAPTGVGSRTPAANAQGWNNADVTASAVCSDALSGITTQPASQTVSAEGASQSRSFTCTDAAGNTATVTVSGISIDKTAPSVTNAQSPAANGAGWNSAAVTVSFACSDALSGVLSAPSNVVLSSEGAGQSASGTCTDKAGNSASSTRSGVNIDLTAPSMSASRSPGANGAGWNNADVTVSYACTDALSGVASVTGSQVVSTEGAAQSRTGTCVDVAGNTASATISNINIDKTAPTLAAHADITAEATSAAGAAVSYAMPAASDALSGAGSVSCSPASGGTFALGDTTIMCSVSDAAGNGASSSFAIHVVDTTAPSIAPHANVAVEQQTAAGSVVTYTAPATSDAVDGNGVASCSPASGSVFAPGSTTVTCTATDAHGNSATSSFLVLVGDTTPPTIDAHADLTAEATSAAGAAVSYAAPATHDAVDGDGVATCAPASGSQFALGSTTTTCSARDAAGNAATSTSFTVTVRDTTAPVIAAANDITAEATSAAGAVVTFGSPTTTDAVDGNGVATCAPASGSQFALGSTTVTCSATDAAGNVATPVSFTVRVVDTTAPVIAAHDDLTAEATGASGAIVTYNAPATTDAVDGSGVATCAPASGSTFPIGTTTVTCSASDAAGNAATATSFLVHVVDASAPTIDPHADITSEATSAAGATVTYQSPATHDTVDGDGVATCAPASGSVFALGDTTVTCSATDSNGNAATPVSFTVSVVDTTPPTIGAVGDEVHEATGAAGAAVDFVTPDTHDAVDGEGVATCAPATGSAFPLGATTVTCSATDAHGNSASRSFTITIVDTTAPVIAAHDDITAEATSASGAAVSFASPATTDAVDGSGVATCAPASGSQFALGSTTITCSATDAAGNAATATSFTVRVVDTAAPVIAAHDDITVEATGASGAVVSFTSPATSDAVDGAGVATCAPASGSTFPIGTTTVACSASDAAGNAAAATSFLVHVVDSSVPTIDAHDDLTAEATSAAGALVTYTSPATHDAVDGDGIASCAPASGSTFALGNTTVTCTATDSNGNAAIPTSFTVSVLDTTPPTIGAIGDQVAEATGADGAIVSFTTPDTHDAVDGDGLATCAPATGSTFPLGSTLVTCTATDAHGNSASRSFAVNVLDTTAPTIAAHDDITAEATSAAGALVTYTSPATHDAVDGDGIASCAPASGSTFALGSTSVTCTATDSNGNAAVPTTFHVSVVDTTAPTIAAHDDITAEATSASGALVSYESPATSDAVDGAGVATCAPASGSTFSIGATTVTCRATDAAGNAASATTFVVRVADSSVPTIDAHDDITAEATSAAGAHVTYTSPATHDAVDGDGVASCAPASGSTFALGSTSVTCTATDSNGNAAAPISFTVTVRDTTAPLIAAASDITAEATAASGATVTYDAPATSDAVDGAGVATCAPASGSTFALGSTSVTCSATDAAGNAATPTSFTVTVRDTTAPVIAAHNDVTAEATSSAGALVSYESPATSDGVDGAGSATCAPASGTTFPIGTTTVTCSAADAAGNAATSTSFIVRVVDASAPVIDAHDDLTPEATSAAGAIVSYASPATHDAVDGDGVATCAPASGTTFALGSTSVTCTAADSNGNAAVPTTFHVSVIDTTAPTVDAVRDVAAEASSAGGAVVSFASPASHDAVDGTGVATCAPASGSTFPLGSTTVTCSATDAAGNAASTSFIVRVGDASPPTIDSVADITVEATGADGALVTYASPATHDTVDGQGVATCAPASGSVFALGDTTITCTATDSNGNAATPVTFTIGVRDTTAPVVTVDGDRTIEATGANGATATFGASATDAVSSVAPTCAPASGSVFPLGTTTVACSATDAAGNTGRGSFRVSVRDTTAPVIAAANDITAEATGASGAAVTFAAPSTSDAVDGSGVATCAPASGSVFALGSTTVTCAASDAAGNAATPVSFTVKVQDTTAPVIAATNDITAAATGASGAAVTFAAPSTTDAVDGAGVATCAPASGSVFALGSTSVTCSATDAAGNAATPTSFTVKVQDTTAPVIAPHADVAVEASSLAGAVVSYTAPATSDAVDGAGVATCAPESGTLFALGNTTVTCAAKDAAGNAASSTSFVVRVTFHAVATLKTDKGNYTLADALQNGIRGVYHLRSGDGSPLRNITVSVRILRQVPVVGFTDHEDWNGTTDANGDFVFHPSKAFDAPVNYVLLGSVQTPGVAGATTGAYSVKAI